MDAASGSHTRALSVLDSDLACLVQFIVYASLCQPLSLPPHKERNSYNAILWSLSLFPVPYPPLSWSPSPAIQLMSSSVQRLFAFAALSYLFSFSFASFLPRHDDHDHSHSATLRSRGAWYQSDDHPAHALFKRASFQTDGQTYAAVGTQRMLSSFFTSS